MVFLLAICVGGSPACALTIETVFVPAGQVISGIGMAKSAPADTVGGGNLGTIIRAAADVWEGLIEDEHTLKLYVGWAPTGSVSSTAYHQGLSALGELNRETLGSLAFNSEYSSSLPLYLDPTPWANEELKFKQQQFADFGGGSIEIMREYSFIDPALSRSRDLYSSALHEIGHALGFAGWSHFEEETLDGDIDIESGPYAGSAIPIVAQHLNVEGPSMAHQGHPAGIRREVTQTDLLAVCELSEFSRCDLSNRSMFSESDFDHDGDVDGGEFLAWQRSQLPNAISTSDLSDWRASYGSPLFAFGDFNHDRRIDGRDFLEWQRGESTNALSASDLATWQASYTAVSLSGLVSGSIAGAARVVPEPTSFVLMIAAGVILYQTRRAKRNCVVTE